MNLSADISRLLSAAWLFIFYSPHFIWKLSRSISLSAVVVGAVCTPKARFDRWKSKYEFSMNTFDDKIVWWLILSINNLALIAIGGPECSWLIDLHYYCCTRLDSVWGCKCNNFFFRLFWLKFYASFFPLQQCNGTSLNGNNYRLSCSAAFCNNLSVQETDTSSLNLLLSQFSLETRLAFESKCKCALTMCNKTESLRLKTQKLFFDFTNLLHQQQQKKSEANDSIIVPARDHKLSLSVTRHEKFSNCVSGKERENTHLFFREG